MIDQSTTVFGGGIVVEAAVDDGELAAIVVDGAAEHGIVSEQLDPGERGAGGLRADVDRTAAPARLVAAAAGDAHVGQEELALEHVEHAVVEGTGIDQRVVIRIVAAVEDDEILEHVQVAPRCRQEFGVAGDVERNHGTGRQGDDVGARAGVGLHDRRAQGAEAVHADHPADAVVDVVVGRIGGGHIDLEYRRCGQYRPHQQKCQDGDGQVAAATVRSRQSAAKRK